MFASPVAKGEIVAGKYRVGKVLGRGGMGVVVGAVDLDLGRPVAIKFVLGSHLENDQAYERFRREARATARIENPHAVRVYESGRHKNGEPFIVMERLKGAVLQQVLEGGPLPVSEAVTYTLQACEGLAAAHATGMVHRDVKPGNLFIEDRTDGTRLLKILDFGLAKSIGSASLTGSERILGSPKYMSPEQIDSPHTVDARSDIWSLGVVLYEALTGQGPFNGSSLLVICAAILHTKPEAPSSIRGDIPSELDDVVMRCLAREPGERYADVGELSTALEQFAVPAMAGSANRVQRTLTAEPSVDIADDDELGDDGVNSNPSVTPWAPPRRDSPSWPRLALGALAIATAVAAGAWLSKPPAEAAPVTAGGAAATAPPQPPTPSPAQRAASPTAAPATAVSPTPQPAAEVAPMPAPAPIAAPVPKPELRAAPARAPAKPRPRAGKKTARDLYDSRQ